MVLGESGEPSRCFLFCVVCSVCIVCCISSGRYDYNSDILPPFAVDDGRGVIPFPFFVEGYSLGGRFVSLVPRAASPPLRVFPNSFVFVFVPGMYVLYDLFSWPRFPLSVVHFPRVVAGIFPSMKLPPWWVVPVNLPPYFGSTAYRQSVTAEKRKIAYRQNITAVLHYRRKNTAIFWFYRFRQ